ncbi:VOC family protein [Fredinandcohnia onubensis]|uniref:VOC family protein n=1 Tax=Fredinandcohnia onubensis TaxID=1571209 RepID=UPI000C0BDF1D|nr:VOC family protein [Fredinandcohnia onubensis]
MDIRFDHVVHYVNDPFEAMTAFRLLGFHTAKGGNHEIWGTYNTLCYFKNLAYIEWIGINHLEVTKEGSHPFSRHLYEDFKRGEGLSQIAFRTNSIDQTNQELTQKGIKTIGPFPGSRMRPDGSLLQWSMLFIDLTQPMPFFIEWGDDDKVREQELIEKEVYVPDSKSISFIAYAVEQAENLADIWAKVLNGTVDNSTIPGTEQKAIKVHFDTIDVYFISLKEHPRGERPFLVGIEPKAQKEISLHGAKYLL